ncbi:hypothetical protein [Lacinutrix sp. Bg11-31]|uniref:hypothetical protein n=1 Tax=Lacinutrix sp. Bg11-31 TaxID=2057808 RepID=UPI000C304E04|nr:hypothetical protein [Lacinutrix sp. Bg11-31]AUC81102.1 hypothetical protein CW733_02735 [Lacinutrix sp. Bg11-31]
MTLEIARVIIDFGLVVLILMVQLLIYPSFKYFTENNLYLWHKRYTKLMAIIVLPLMVTQLILALLVLIKTGGIILIIYFVLVCLTWIATILIFVPLHNRISNRKITNNTISDLIILNWLRVAIWTIIFIISLFNHK